MKCLRCGNVEWKWFFRDARGYYCLRCVAIQRLYVGERPQTVVLPPPQGYHYFSLAFSLSEDQLRLIREGFAALRGGNNVFLHAACGAGKSEVALGILVLLMNRGQKVAFCVTRTQVALELYHRFSQIMLVSKVVVVCGGHHQEHDGDLIILTPQQLFRYHQTFDYVVVDEVDAFPFDGNRFLYQMLYNSVKKQYLFMSATISPFLAKLLPNFQMFTLYRRFHLRPVPVPRIIPLPMIVAFWWLVLKIKQSAHRWIIYAPTKERIHYYATLLGLVLQCRYVYSELEDKEEVIQEFRDRKFRVLISSILLERGITVVDVSVVVLDLEHQVFREENLIQIAGRVDRGMESYHGQVYFVCAWWNRKARRVVEQIRQLNR